MITCKVLLISTGGTIAGNVSRDKLANDYEVRDAKSFSELIAPTVTYLLREQDVSIDVTPYELFNVDSSDVSPYHWSELIDTVHEKYDDYDAFIITHGTNTMGYTAAALSFGLENNAKPVILTGSQIPIDMPGSDARTNLENAFRIAAWQKEEIYGVIAVFGSQVIAGTRVKKSTEFDYDAFVAFQDGDIGEIGRILVWDKEKLYKHNSYLSEGRRVAKKKEHLNVSSKFNNNILSITEHPGLEPEALLIMVTRARVKGVIIRAFGAGDAASSLLPTLEQLKLMGIPVVITTQSPNGNANMQVNEPGQRIESANLGVPAYDMSIESCSVKLMWLLAKMDTGDLNYDQVMKEMIDDKRGEVQVLYEDNFL